MPTSPLTAARILAIEVTGDGLRACLMVKKGPQGSVLASAAIARHPRDADDDSLLLPSEIGELAERCDARGVPVVVATERATAVPLTFSARRMQRMTMHQLRSALRWEAEAFLEVPPTEVLGGYELIEEADTQGRDRAVMGYFLPRAQFDQCRQDCQDAGTSLRRIYASDAALGALLHLRSARGGALLCHLSPSGCTFLALVAGRLAAPITLPIGSDAIRDHLELGTQEDLAAYLREAVEVLGLPEAVPLRLCGVGCDEAPLRAWLGRACGRQVLMPGVALAPAATAEISAENTAGASGAAPGPAPGEAAAEEAALVAVAWGAALRECGYIGRRHVGIDDSEPMTTVMRKKLHTLPVWISALVVLLLLLHYTQLRWRVGSLEDTLADLQGRIAERTAALEAEQVLRERQSAMRRELRELEALRRFHNGSENRQRRDMAHLIDDLGRCIPEDLVLLEVTPLPGAQELGWRLSGRCARAAAVHTYRQALLARPWCQAVGSPQITSLPAAAAQAPRRRQRGVVERPDPVLALPQSFSFTISLRDPTEEP